MVMSAAAPTAALVKITGRELYSCFHFNMAKREWESTGKSFNVGKWAKDLTTTTLGYMVGGTVGKIDGLENGFAVTTNMLLEVGVKTSVGAGAGSLAGYTSGLIYDGCSRYIHSPARALNHGRIVPDYLLVWFKFKM